MEENELLNYMRKLQNMVDYLARGGILQSPEEDVAIEIVSSEKVKKRNVISVQEYDMYDELEISFFGEQRSIGILMEYINDGEYERQVERKIDFDKPYTPKPENAEFYKRVMKRARVVFKMMALYLVAGSQIPLKEVTFGGLKKTYLDEHELAEYEDDTEGSLVYDAQNGQFSVLNLDGEVVVEYVAIDIAMDIYNKFLLKQELDDLYKKAINIVQLDEHQEETDAEERE